MNTGVLLFDEQEMLHQLTHYLPSQTPLKDFVHHNTLHAFQHLPFFEGIHQASTVFGYRVFAELDEYRQWYKKGTIDDRILRRIIAEKKGPRQVDDWMQRMKHKTYDTRQTPRIGQFRNLWKEVLKIDLNALVHPILFRVLSNYLDQGIATWSFPVACTGLLEALLELERNSASSLFRTTKVRQLFRSGSYTLTQLLDELVGNTSYYDRYVFDQQFAHPGWSGMVAAIAQQPETLLAKRPVSLHDLIVFELLLELDALEFQTKGKWAPLAPLYQGKSLGLFDPMEVTELDEVYRLWQDAFEWSYYDQVLAALKVTSHGPEAASQSPQFQTPPQFQALFCIDDRECSIRRHVEQCHPHAETFGTPGFFGVPFYYLPKGSQAYTKLAPGPVQPRHLIKERSTSERRIKLQKDVHFNKHSHNFHSGWIWSQTVGFWSAVRLVDNIIRPSMAPMASSSLNHMDPTAELIIENEHPDDMENGLRVGFTVSEMANCVANVLLSIGLTYRFAPLVYVIGHGASSINNPHYAAYDCGACCGRAGSVNARVFSYMANKPEVRALLAQKGIYIPAETQFIGGLHDTTRDDMVFFDEGLLNVENRKSHDSYVATFTRALDLNAKERSRKFESINTKKSPERVHRAVRKRSVSLFEPRPELNHATNALTVIGGRYLTRDLFLDRRSFLNSYDYRIDPEGTLLLAILRAATPVCGGINLEYYFSRVDNDKLGASSKLPHNVMGLIGVANGADGDLRPGLPSQMIEVHDPIRMFFVVEQVPEIVLQAIKSDKNVYEWYRNEWVHLVALEPRTHRFYVFSEDAFVPYEPIGQAVATAPDLLTLFEQHRDALPVMLLQNKH
ncbi:YbcC family protein [Parapedobacter koreensis]|uniref:Probable inorganic carbon transporter subunit DabA n=1 Tax=Parapedobacter koreensis TaxID=332977 RepID=A0A1H7FJL5_9SPHI|nr:DUF2309 domain-containing protein [Parapedobacter koreensis]SEK26231.1 hypothetical protein SAMN05421740_101375 [Parapedobacter koreensis]